MPTGLFGSKFAGGNAPKTPKSLVSNWVSTPLFWVKIAISPAAIVSGLQIANVLPLERKNTEKFEMVIGLGPVLSRRMAPESKVWAAELWLTIPGEPSHGVGKNPLGGDCPRSRRTPRSGQPGPPLAAAGPRSMRAQPPITFWYATKRDA